MVGSEAQTYDLQWERLVDLKSVTLHHPTGAGSCCFWPTNRYSDAMKPQLQSSSLIRITRNVQQYNNTLHHPLLLLKYLCYYFSGSKSISNFHTYSTQHVKQSFNFLNSVLTTSTITGGHSMNILHTFLNDMNVFEKVELNWQHLYIFA